MIKDVLIVILVIGFCVIFYIAIEYRNMYRQILSRYQQALDEWGEFLDELLEEEE